MSDLRRLISVRRSRSGRYFDPCRIPPRVACGGRRCAIRRAGISARMLTPAEAADWLHAQLGGRKRSAAAIRKVMRSGFRGVVLKSYPFGRERRTTEADLQMFVAQIGTVPRAKPPKQIAISTIAAPFEAKGFEVKSDADPADKIAAAQDRFRRHRQPPLTTAARQRRAAGGA